MDERESLLFMATSFNAVVCGTHETYEQFRLGCFSKAEKFGKFLDTKGYHRSSIVGHHDGGWRITVWFTK